MNRNAELIRLLLDKGAKLNAQEPTNGETPLIRAVENDDRHAMRLLLAHGAHTDLRDKLGQTALQWAIKRKNKQTAEMLKAAGTKQ